LELLSEAGSKHAIVDRTANLEQKIGLVATNASAAICSSSGSPDDQVDGMNCICCGSMAVTERPEVTAQGYRRFRCRDGGRQFNERRGSVLNRTCLPSDVIAFVVFCRLRYRLTLRDLTELLFLRGIEVSHETVREWETKLLPVMGDALRKRRHGLRRGSGVSWYDETYLKVRASGATFIGRSTETGT
jgi:transposase-like protein